MAHIGGNDANLFAAAQVLLKYRNHFPTFQNQTLEYIDNIDRFFRHLRGTGIAETLLFQTVYNPLSADTKDMVHRYNERLATAHRRSVDRIYAARNGVFSPLTVDAANIAQIGPQPTVVEMQTLLTGWNIDWNTAVQNQNLRNRAPYEALILNAPDNITDHGPNYVVAGQPADPLRKETGYQTIEHFKNWVLELFPPQLLKSDMVEAMEDIEFTRNSNPSQVFEQMLNHFDRIDKALTLCNKYGDGHPQTMLTDQEKVKALLNTFYHTNTDPATINYLTQKEVKKYSSTLTTVAEWVTYIPKLTARVMPPVRRHGDPTYRFTQVKRLPLVRKSNYLPNQFDRNSKRKRDQNNDGYQSKRTKKNEICREWIKSKGKRCKFGKRCIYAHPPQSNGKPQGRDSSFKASGKKCFRCQRTGHLRQNCRAKKDVNGRPLPGPNNSNPNNQRGRQNTQCSRCHRSGHHVSKCRATRFANGNPIPKRPNQPNYYRPQQQVNHDPTRRMMTLQSAEQWSTDPVQRFAQMQTIIDAQKAIIDGEGLKVEYQDTSRRQRPQ